MKKILENKKIIIIIIFLIIFFGGFFVFFKEENDEFLIDNIADENILSSEENNVVNNINNEINIPTQIYIHIIGEVQNPGIVVLDEGSRIIDAIEKAGGTTPNADVSKVNLAFILSDGQKVNIPNINDKMENFVYVTDNSGNNVIIETSFSSSGGGKVNINTATQTELETLTGIGPSTAAKIIEYREENGNFKSIEDVKNVSGIGNAKYESIRESITVK